MIDIHSHVLPGLDDGAQTLEQAVAMVRMAAASGTTDIVATPHANHKYAYDSETVVRKILELTAASGNVIRIHHGCEFYLSAPNILDALENSTKYTINGKGYLLVEFPDLMTPSGMDGTFARLQTSRITPIIAHPERNFLLQGQAGRIAAWVRNGCLVQITAQSLLGTFGKRAQACAEELMERQLVHFVASDAHDLEHRPPVLTVARAKIVSTYGEERASALLVKNPASVLAGDPIGS